LNEGFGRAAHANLSGLGVEATLETFLFILFKGLFDHKVWILLRKGTFFSSSPCFRKRKITYNFIGKSNATIRITDIQNFLINAPFGSPGK